MSKTFHREKELARGIGKEYWKSRLHPQGEIPGKFTKRLTHKKERKINKDVDEVLNEFIEEETENEAGLLVSIVKH